MAKATEHYYHDLTRPQLRDVLPAVPEQCALSDSIRAALDARKRERERAGIEAQEQAR